MLSPDDNWLWARLERPSTDSWMTVCLGTCFLDLPDEQCITRLIAEYWPGWEPVTWGRGCPDGEEPELFPGELI